HVPNLEKLYLCDSPIRDFGMIHLTKLSRLHEVDLIGLSVSDDGIATLTALPRLQFLDVSGTPITETGLLAFRNARTLKYLGVGPQASSYTLNTLTSALPGCQVFDSGGSHCMQGW